MLQFSHSGGINHLSLRKFRHETPFPIGILKITKVGIMMELLLSLILITLVFGKQTTQELFNYFGYILVFIFAMKVIHEMLKIAKQDLKNSVLYKYFKN